MFKSKKTTNNKLMGAGKNRLDVFEKIEIVRSLIINNVENLNDKEIQSELCRCWYYNIGRREEITPRQHEILDLLLKNNINPKTAYHYFLLNNAPDHIKLRLREKKVSMRDAVSISSKYNKLESMKGSEKLMEEIRTIVGGLKWESQEQ